MTQKSKTSASQKRRAQSSQSSNRPLLIVGGVVVVAVIAVVIAFSLGSAEPSVAEPAAAVSMSGTALPQWDPDVEDGAVGMELPGLAGTDQNGDPLTIGPDDGVAKGIVVLSHQCPHCQAELPRLVAWLADNPAPDGVEVLGLSTLINPAGTNFPSIAWLEREGWTAPTLIDDAAYTAMNAYGSMFTPGFIFVTADGVVASRVTGEIDPADFGAMLEAIAP